MIKFEEHDGMLFKMLEEPVPLTDDSELPVLVRLIQDDTMLGKANKRSCHPDTLAQKIICSSSNLTDDGLFMDGDYTYRYEIIGTFVEEGSDDWAWYQMMQGEKIRYAGMKLKGFYAIKKGCDYCALYKNNGNEVSITTRRTYGEFIEFSRRLMLSWQIYTEPQPESQYKVGDWVEWCGDQYMVKSAPPQSGGRYNIRSPYDELGWSVYPENITRKLSPADIVIRIGCLSGTIAKSSYPDYFLMLHSRPVTDCNHSMIRFSALDTPTRKLVESLLKAQEEE